MAQLWQSVILLFATFYLVLAKHEAYDGHTLYEIPVKNAEESQFINELENEMAIDTFLYGHPERPAQILVSKELKEKFEMLLTSKGIEYVVKTKNIREQLELEDQLLAAAAAKSNSSSRSTPSLDLTQIHRFQAVDNYLVRLAAAHPNIVTVASAGRSFEGRDIKYLKISTTNFQDRRKPVVFLMSLLHAREWVTLPGTLFAIERLVVDVRERDLLDSIDWIIMPIANPDGYEFSHTNNRFWRKNRATGFMVGNFCMGVDLNRNFDIFWGTASSSNVCMETFHGRSAFSEPETQHIRRILTAHRDRIALAIDLHSFGSMILFSWGTGALPPNALEINRVGVLQAQAIDRVKWPQHANYRVGNIRHVLNMAASGGSIDYILSIGVPYTYAYELPSYRGITNHLDGFLVEPEFVWQAGFETWEGIKAGAREARNRFLRRGGE